jgi:uncharacterized protein YaaN involved in tellurite resistance
MSVGALGRNIASPAADASRVAAIRNKLDLSDTDAVAGFGEPARKGVLAGIERFLVEVRNNPVGDAVERLNSARARLESLDPSELEPRGGFDSLFNGRSARLHRFRRAFESVAAEFDVLAAEMGARVQKIGQQSEALNGLHEQARTLILELDAYLDAGRARLADARSAAAAEPQVQPQADPAASAAVDAAAANPAMLMPAPKVSSAERLAGRLDDLDRARSATLQQLPLARVVQNADAFLADDLARVGAILAAWRKAWSDLLGIGRGDRARPHMPALAEAKLNAVQSLGRVTAALDDQGARRSEAEVRMKTAAAGVSPG